MVHDVYFAISENSKNKVLTLSKKFGIKIKLLQIIKQVELPFKIDFYLKNRFDWIVFTSSFGVKVFSEKVMKTGAFHYLLNTRFAAVGQETANALRSYGFGVDFVPEHFTTDELASKIPVANGAKILTVRSKQGDDILEKTLTERSCHVTRLNAYTEVIRSRPVNFIKKDDFVVFGSSYILEIFTKLLKNVRPSEIFALPIGPKTFSRAIDYGYKIRGSVKTYTYEGVFETLREMLNGV